MENQGLLSLTFQISFHEIILVVFRVEGYEAHCGIRYLFFWVYVITSRFLKVISGPDGRCTDALNVGLLFSILLGDLINVLYDETNNGWLNVPLPTFGYYIDIATVTMLHRVELA
jgi:hypothetical protein